MRCRNLRERVAFGILLVELGRKYIEAVSRQSGAAGTPDDEESEMAIAPPKAALLDSAAWFEGVDAPRDFGNAASAAASATAAADDATTPDALEPGATEESAAVGLAATAVFGQTGAWHEGGATGSSAHREVRRPPQSTAAR